MSNMEEINKLVLSQQEVAQSMAQLLRNIKKDPATRKSESYRTTRITTFEAFWSEAEVNHAKILQLNIKEHEYFNTSYFAQMEAIYKEAMDLLKERPKSSQEFEQPTTKTENIVEDAEQELRLKKQAVKMEQLQKTINQIQVELPEEKTKTRLETLRKKATKQWDAIQDLHEEIMVQEKHFQASYFSKNKYHDMEKIYEDLIEELEQKIFKSSFGSSKPNIALPMIKIPYFEGGYEHWTSFHDIFLKVIHANSTLSDTEKMQYLKTHVRGEPSKLIQHLQTNEANYDTAWDLLQKRYQNHRLLLFKLVDKILDLPPIQQESVEKIKQLHDVTTECLEAVNNLGIPTDAWGPLVGRIIMRKWDAETSKLYEQSLRHPNEVQEFETLMEFLQVRFQSLEAIAEAKKRNQANQNSSNPPKWQPSYNNSHFPSYTTSVHCKYCKQNHNLYSCPKFRLLPVADKYQFTKEKRLCINCLNHDVNERCRSTLRCRICRSPHHTSMHKEQRQQAKPLKTVAHTTTKTETPSTSMQQPQKVISSHAGQDETVLLATALVQAKSSMGTVTYLRALIDPGSQASFITENAAQLLAHPRQKIQAQITGLGNGEPKISNAQIHAQMFPRFPSNFSLNIDLLILPKLTQTLPSISFPNTNLQHWKNHIIADPTFNESGPIDVILGAEVYGLIITEGLIKTQDGLLGQNTKLGWILSGKVTKPKSDNVKIVSMVTCKEDQQLTKFWDLEEVAAQRPLNADEEACEEKFSTTFKRNKNGSYTVQIPFKERPEDLGNSKSRAFARLTQLEKKLSTNKELEHQYKEFMKEYLKLGHMKKVTAQDREGKYYIPHQAVIRESSTTTKLRVVFDASSKTSFGLSLNDTMHVGPRLQQDLSDILLRWRKYQIVFTADIEKMYRQIHIHKHDQPFQRILWRFNPMEKIEEFQLTTVTYGTASAPYLAIRTLQQLAKDEENNFPKAAVIAKKDFYVDDLLSGAHTLKEATELVPEITKMLKSGGFVLRKWLSNNSELLQSIPEDLRDQKTLEIESDGTRKSLGILWSPREDTFKFQLQFFKSKIITKRLILSEIAKLFDPLGWLAPIVITAKLLIQQLWLQDLEWDKQVPENIETRWLLFQEQLQAVHKINIPRWIHYNQNHIELHGFCDASEKAYGAVIYSRTIDDMGETRVTLLTAKSKVAPARKKTTVPKLELCAALLLGKLMKKTQTALEFDNIQSFAWTDSMITLGWIRGDPGKWKTFVANRVSQIQTLVPNTSWHHVRTEENPADPISRGLDPTKIEGFKLWWEGPKWLADKNQWPLEEDIPPTKLEMRQCLHTITPQQEETVTNRFSSLTRMLRVLAYCRRFIHSCKKVPKDQDYLTTKELNDTLLQVVKVTQYLDFKKEITLIQKHQQLEKNSKLYNLNPFIDQDGILRVGGRLQNSLFQYNQKHPIILNSHSHLSDLIIHDAHLKTLHGGNQATLAYTRRKYWIINGKKRISSILNKCTRCLRFKAEAAQQQMGQLPASRVTPSPPFTHAGIDYAGPIQIRTSKGRGQKSYKGYIAIFVCLATKAIHLEVVSDLTTATFLAAFRRFAARRGYPVHLYSDHGTNFVGAKSIIEKEIREVVNNKKIHEELASQGTQWHFIPPAAPHFGGLWEAGVKSMKYHLKRIIGDSTLTFEELSTLIYQIEACLNSRPLCPQNNDATCLQALTPGHFLIGRELVTPPDPDTTDISSSVTTRWKLIQKMRRDFWKIWTNDYLNTLQQRYKWKSKENNLEVGDMVLLKEANINPTKWPLGRIEKVYQGNDGLVRVVDIRKEGGVISKRPIQKIIPLHLNSDNTPDDPVVTRVSTNYVTTNISNKPTTTLHCNTKQEKPKSRREAKPASWNILATLILWTLISLTSVHAHFNVRYPHSGLYIEHIGHATIDRGTFRIELKFDKNKTTDDTAAVSKVLEEVTNLCHEAQQLSKATECTSLLNHLNEEKKHIDWLIRGMDEVVSTREKRGLLGNFLTSVFGVNDEVYKDIETLDKNQRDLIKASNHQTKIMLSTLSAFNDTAVRINKQMEHFREKLNQGIQAINEMSKWYKAVDDNKLAIHVLSSYQVAANYLAEIRDYYTKLLNIHHSHGSIYDFISPAHIRDLIKNASEKLPANIIILPTPIIKTKVTHSLENIHIFGYFLMTESADFVVIKSTPIPLKVENGSYWVLDITNKILAIDYNIQLYFQLSEEEFKNCVALESNEYVCSPMSINNIETSPNCVIDEIYQRTETTSCNIISNNIRSIIWKQLYTPNSWLFITPTKTKVAITCNGIREEVQLNKTGILQVSSDSLIKTKQNILTPRRTDHVAVLAGYSKHIAPNISSNVTLKQVKEISEEPIMKVSDQFENVKLDEEQLKEELQESNWDTVKPHVIGHTINLTIVLITAVMVWAIYWCWKGRQARNNHTRTTVQSTSLMQPQEMIELQTFEPAQGRGETSTAPKDSIIRLKPLFT